jgi:hypothetical protein
MQKFSMHAATIAMGAAICLLSITGCASNEIKWTEEVRLHDGKIVQVKRRTELTESGFPTQNRGFHKYHELCFAPMGIYWKSKPEYRLYVFDIVDGKAYIKVPVQGCTTCMLQGYPAWDAAYFEWNNGAWKKVDENPTLRALRFNLLSATHAGGPYRNERGEVVPAETFDARGLIALADKERRDASIYHSMKNTGRTGPSVAPGACERCKAEKVETSMTSEVFLPSESRTCNW